MPAQTNPKSPVVVYRGSLKSRPLGRNDDVVQYPYYSDFRAGYSVSASTAVFPPHEACSTHNHRGGNEHFLVLGGRGVILVDGNPIEVAKGDMVVAPAGMHHSIIAGRTTLELFCQLVVAPGHENDREPWLPTK
jgi:mannose-6-phosphate isomerase-like protein (cupin superfamily)